MEVSIITATWNRHEQLKKAVKSIQNQTFTDWEHIIVSDGPDPALKPILDSMGHTYKLYECGRNWGSVMRPNVGGIPKATGCNLASGNYIAYLDDDNQYLPCHLEKLVSKIKEGYDFVYSVIDTRTDFAKFGKNVLGSPPPRYGDMDTNIILHKWQNLLKHNWDGKGYQDDWFLVEKWLKSGLTWGWIPDVTVLWRPRD